MAAKKRVLILCTGNSCRSQMAEAILKQLRPDWEIYSAGTAPAERVHPKAVQVMREIGLDISGAAPKHVDQLADMPFDWVITVCDSARQSCPVFTGRVSRQLHLDFRDPAQAAGTQEEILAVFRQVRDEIRREFAKLVERLGPEEGEA